MFESCEELTARLTATGYFIDPVMLKVVYLAARMQKPLLLEGPAGSGKTQLAVSVAKAAGTHIERLQCYRGVTEDQAIGRFDEGLQRLYMEFARGEHADWQSVQTSLKGRDFFRAGPLMRALESEQPCVLLIDELDKVDEGFEAMLLEILSAWQLSIPEFGTVEAKSIPFVVLTSNEERRLGDPIRRRSLYVRVEHPTPAREAEIIASRTPEADEKFHREMAGIALSFRNYSLEKPPSVSEMIDFANALRLLGADHVTEDLRDVLLPFLAKTEKDRRHLLLREGFKSLLVDGARFAARSDATNQAEIADCVSIANSVGVEAIVVGSESLLQNYVTPQQLIAYINEVRTDVPGVPVTTADTVTVLENNPDVVAACDFVFVNYYPFWEGVALSSALADLNAEDAYLRAAYAPKEVIVSETGWQSFGSDVGNAAPSAENAASYFLDFESWAQAGQRKTFYFEAHDEPWKGTDNGWGIWDDTLTMKPGMEAVSNGETTADNWTCGATPGGSGSPMLQFTSVPALGSSALLEGQEWHEPPADYYVVVYIHVGSLGWWVKPYAANPNTLINCNGSWSANIVTGGSDASADTITAFLIPTTYSPPILEGASSLPQALYTNSAANVTASR